MRGIARRVVRAAPIIVDAVRAVRRWGFANVFRGTQKINASLGRYPLFRLFNALTGNRLPPRRSAYSSVALDNCPPWPPLAAGDEIPSSGAAAGVPPGFREDVVTQNQLTLVTVVDPRQVRRVGAVMAAIDAFSPFPVRSSASARFIS
jgi:hypothetical protein